jgi:putative sterol carrier protein
VIEETLASLVERFNRRVERTPAIREELVGLERTISIHLSDDKNYAVDLKNAQLQNLRTTDADRADLTVSTDRATFLALVSKELGPMKALVTRRLTIAGTLEDKLLLRRLLQ